MLYKALFAIRNQYNLWILSHPGQQFVSCLATSIWLLCLVVAHWPTQSKLLAQFQSHHHPPIQRTRRYTENQGHAAFKPLQSGSEPEGNV